MLACERMRAYGMQSGSADYAELLASVRRAKPLGIALTKPLNLCLHSLNLCLQHDAGTARHERRKAADVSRCLASRLRPQSYPPCPLGLRVEGLGFRVEGLEMCQDALMLCVAPSAAILPSLSLRVEGLGFRDEL
jgi:hypothetical protein